MDRVAFLIIYMMTCCIQSFPIDNGFTIKLKPLTAKQDVKPENAGTVFTNPQIDAKVNEEQNMWDVWNKLFFSQTAMEHKSDQVNLGTNVQLGATTKPSTKNEVIDVPQSYKMNYLNLPVINQPYNDYKVLVAAAPPNMRSGSNADKRKLYVYVVIPDDSSDENPNFEEIPKVFFVNENIGKRKVLKKRIETDPILIVDNNRTVTGLKSKEVPKFVRFKNKLTNRFNYNVTG